MKNNFKSMITNSVLGLENNFESQTSVSVLGLDLKNNFKSMITNLVLYSNNIFVLMGLSPLKSQFTNLCKCVAFAVVRLKF